MDRPGGKIQFGCPKTDPKAWHMAQAATGGTCRVERGATVYAPVLTQERKAWICHSSLIVSMLITRQSSGRSGFCDIYGHALGEAGLKSERITSNPTRTWFQCVLTPVDFGTSIAHAIGPSKPVVSRHRV